MGLAVVPIHCGTLRGIERSTQQYLVGCGEHIDVPLVMWAILGGAAPIVIDVGAGSPDVVKKYQGRDLLQETSLLARLKELGLAPADIGTVVITHAHWDHLLGLETLEFPRAKIYVQRRELEFAADPVPPQRGFYNRQAVEWLTVDPSRAPRREVIVIDGDYDLGPGIRILLTPGHTPGTSAVLVETAGGTYAISSDTVPRAGSIRGAAAEDWHAPGIHVNLAECYESMNRLAREADFVLPSHDESVFAREAYS